jgi:hypothetical protein
MKKPIRFIILKIVGFVGVAVLIAGIVLAIKGFGDFESNNFMIGTFVAVAGVAIAGTCLARGFGPEIAKARTKTIRYIQEENKDDLSAIATNTAQITSDAVTITAHAVKDGIKETKFCKHCGEKIDKDSKFCASCGKEQ